MKWEIAVVRLMSMSDEVWMRHANPWSGLTRMATGPVLLLAAWSHVWIGWWAVLPVAVLAMWAWLNPRLFPPPASTDNWMSRGVLGERVWLNRKQVPIPHHHELAGHLLSALAIILMVPAIYGLIVADVWAAVLGWHGAIIAKIWFVDRMVWLYADMHAANPTYRSWLY